MTGGFPQRVSCVIVSHQDSHRRLGIQLNYDCLISLVLKLVSWGAHPHLAKHPFWEPCFLPEVAYVPLGRSVACEYILWNAGAVLAGRRGEATDGALPVYNRLGDCHFAQGGKKNILLGKEK